MAGDQDIVARDLGAAEPGLLAVVLLSPARERARLTALFALLAEAQRAVLTATEPHLAAIRLAWWRETLENQSGATIASPLARLLRETALTEQSLSILDGCECLLPTFDTAAEAIAALGEGQDLIATALVGPSRVVTPREPAACRAHGTIAILRHMPRLMAAGRAPWAGTPEADARRLLERPGPKEIIGVLDEWLANAGRAPLGILAGSERRVMRRRPDLFLADRRRPAPVARLILGRILGA